MKRILNSCVSLAILCIATIGCGGAATSTDSGDATTTDSSASQTPTFEEPVAPVESEEERASAFELAPAQNASPAAEPNAGDSTKAETGVGRKGSNYGGGLVSEPARQYFRLQERIVFDVQIPSAMKTYKAINGNNPKTHDEFMDKIVKENAIKLPELPAGSTFAYDPAKGELMVQKGG